MRRLKNSLGQVTIGGGPGKEFYLHTLLCTYTCRQPPLGIVFTEFERFTVPEKGM